jgi:hypothetical protein
MYRESQIQDSRRPSEFRVGFVWVRFRMVFSDISIIILSITYSPRITCSLTHLAPNSRLAKAFGVGFVLPKKHFPAFQRTVPALR